MHQSNTRGRLAHSPKPHIRGGFVRLTPSLAQEARELAGTRWRAACCDSSGRAMFYPVSSLPVVTFRNPKRKLVDWKAYHADITAGLNELHHGADRALDLLDLNP